MVSLIKTLPRELREETVFYCFEFACVLEETSLFSVKHSVRRKSENTVTNMAVRGGHLSLLKWAFERKYPCLDDLCYVAARHGHLHILQWIRTVDT